MARSRAAVTNAQIGLPALADGTIEGNVFDGLTVPVLVIGGLGTVRVEENTVRACYGGFWLLHTATAAGLTLLDRATSADEAAWTFIVTAGLSALGDPAFLLATVLGRILPVTPDQGDPAGSIGKVTAPTKALLADAEKTLRALYMMAAASEGQPAAQPAAAAQEPGAAEEPAGAAEEPAGAAQEPAGAAQEPAGAAAQPVDTALPFPRELSQMFTSTAAGVRLGQAPAADPGTGLEPRLEVSSNQVDAVIAESDSGPGLIVLTLDPANASSLVCSHNRIRSRVASGSTVSVLELLESALTGNIVSNESGGEIDRSLVLVPTVPRKVAAVAVTGNVLIGPAVLPVRQLPAPFNTWNGLNTLMTASS